MAEKQNMRGWCTCHPVALNLPASQSILLALGGQASALLILIAVCLFLDEAVLLALASLLSLPANILCFPNIFLKRFLCEIFPLNSDPHAFHRGSENSSSQSSLPAMGQWPEAELLLTSLPPLTDPWAQRISFPRRDGIFCSDIFLTCFMSGHQSLSTLINGLAIVAPI